MDAGHAILAGISAILAVALVAVIVGSQQTGTVISSAGTALSTVIKAAVSPVTSTTTATL